MSESFEKVIATVDLNAPLDNLINQSDGVMDTAPQKIIENGTTYCLSDVRLSEADPACEVIGIYTECE